MGEIDSPHPRSIKAEWVETLNYLFGILLLSNK